MMKRPLFSFIAIGLLVAASGFIAGYHSPTSLSNSSRSIASEHDEMSYAQLPCATQSEFDSLSRILKIKKRPDGQLCGDGSSLEKLGKLLVFIQSLAVDVPSTWKWGATSALSNPLDYLQRNLKSISYDSVCSIGAMAYNENDGHVFLCPIFFSIQGPLDGALTLIHEARHSESDDPGHVPCVYGDRARQSGACDAELNVEHPGAYSYEILFAIGLEKLHPNLSKSDRRFLDHFALNLFGIRLNRIPAAYALPFETLVLLDEEGQLSFVHPLLKTRLPIDTSMVDGKIQRIEFDRRVAGVRAYASSGEIYELNAFSDLHERATDRIPRDVPIRDIEILTFGSRLNNEAQTYFIGTDNAIRYVDFDNEAKQFVIKDSDYHSSQDELMRLIHAHDLDRYALTANGELLGFDRKKATLSPSIFQEPDGNGWRLVHGGILYVDMIGLSRQGVLYTRQKNATVRSDFQSLLPSIKELDSLNYRVHLTKAGQLHIQNYFGKSNPLLYLSSPSRFIDVSVIRRFYLQDDLTSAESINPRFIGSCNILPSQVYIDPWTGRSMGISRTGQLVFEGETDKTFCTPLPGTSGLRSLIFEGVSPQKQGEFSQIYLKAQRQDGSIVVFYPYM